MVQNIKVMVGQVWEWECESDSPIYCQGNKILISEPSKNYKSSFNISPVNFVRQFGNMSLSAETINKHFKFIPQTDLEWLAVNADE